MTGLREIPGCVQDAHLTQYGRRSVGGPAIARL